MGYKDEEIMAEKKQLHSKKYRSLKERNWRLSLRNPFMMNVFMWMIKKSDFPEERLLILESAFICRKHLNRWRRR